MKIVSTSCLLNFIILACNTCYKQRAYVSDYNALVCIQPPSLFLSFAIHLILLFICFFPHSSPSLSLTLLLLLLFFLNIVRTDLFRPCDPFWIIIYVCTFWFCISTTGEQLHCNIIYFHNIWNAIGYKRFNWFESFSNK